jgi:hypothetical protein
MCASCSAEQDLESSSIQLLGARSSDPIDSYPHPDGGRTLTTLQTALDESFGPFDANAIQIDYGWPGHRTSIVCLRVARRYWWPLLALWLT